MNSYYFHRRVDEGDMPEFDAAMSRLRHKRPKKDLSVEESEALDTAAADFVIKMEAAAELGMITHLTVFFMGDDANDCSYFSYLLRCGR